MRVTFRNAGSLMFLFAFCLLVWGIIDHPRALAGDKRGDYFPKVTLKTQDNKDVSFYDDLIKDKIVIINLMYTECETCLRGTKNLVQVQKALGDRLGKEVFMYSITLDPEHDSPEVLKAYAKTNGAKPGWTFLTGKAKDINALRLKLGLSNPDPELLDKLRLPKSDPKKEVNQKKEVDPKLHTGMIVVGYDAFNRWSKMSILSRPDQILQVIERMKPPSRPKK